MSHEDVVCNVQYVSPGILKAYANNARKHPRKQVAKIARSIQSFGFLVPIVVDKDLIVIAGHGRLAAAKDLRLRKVPIIRVEHLNDVEVKAYRIADNKLCEDAGWDEDILKIELQSLLEIEVDFDLTVTAFETPELDIILRDVPKKQEHDPDDAMPDASAIQQRVSKGDLWRLGKHFLYCGDALQPESFEILLQGKTADVVVTDPPYNVRVDGHVCGTGGVKHNEFAYASGEMSEAEFITFLRKSFSHLVKYSADGSMHFIFMDWRHIGEIVAAGKDVYSELKNVCVWNKQLGGLGSLYRSQHELIFVFKNGTATHLNNIELGRYGRNRTNVWDYVGVNAASHRRDELKLHPTVKPVRMLSDAIIDCSKQDAIVLDCFAGSGSTLLAAERAKRKAYLIEFEPKYCDVILYRYEKAFGGDIELVRSITKNPDPTHLDSGEENGERNYRV
jgi:DNA modification methylase